MTTKKEFHLALREAREKAKISEADAASMANLNASWYWDQENNADEWWSVTPLVCTIPLINYFKIEWEKCFDWPAGKRLDFRKAANEHIAETRKELGLSLAEFCERCGLYESFGFIIEGHYLGLYLYPPDVLVEVAKTLGIDASDLMRLGMKQ